jgi:hypothetical protein
MFVGYPKEIKGFTFYNPEDDKNFISTNARFLEEDFMKDVKPRSKIVLEEKLGEEASTSSVRTVLTPTETQPNLSEPGQVVIRRSGRAFQKPDRYMSFGDTLVAVSDMDDPVSYSQAMACSESNIWLDAMKVEMHLMYVNKV